MSCRLSEIVRPRNVCGLGPVRHETPSERIFDKRFRPRIECRGPTAKAICCSRGRGTSISRFAAAAAGIPCIPSERRPARQSAFSSPRDVTRPIKNKWFSANNGRSAFVRGLTGSTLVLYIVVLHFRAKERSYYMLCI